MVFSAPGAEPGEAARRIEAAIELELGVTARTIVLTAAQLSAAVAANPLSGIADNPSRLLVAFHSEAAVAQRLAPLVQVDWAPEAFELRGRVAYLWCPGGVSESRLAAALAKAAGDAVTSRNWATVLKLQGLLGAGGGEHR